MARPLRIEFTDAWYHVMNRGAARRNIFLIDHHQELFLKILAEISELFGVEIHGYCLMSNHYHLLIKTPRANLSRAMRHLDGVYTQRFNRMERRDGPLFKGRYKSMIIDEENYLVAVNRYIHRNPLEAKICSKAGDYRWSSYPAYLNLVPKPDWLCTRDVLARAYPPGLESYKTFVENALVPSLGVYYRSNRIAPILGGKAFKISVGKRIEHPREHPEIPEARWVKEKQQDFVHIFEQVSNVVGCTPESIRTGTRGKANPARNLAMYIARQKCGHSLNSIAQAFGVSAYSTVSNVVKQISVALEGDAYLRLQVESIEQNLRN